jgi:two-component system chemotaxis response regulator CheB
VALQEFELPVIPDPPAAIHVLVVDDSAVVRQVLSGILGQEPGMSVSVAADPIIAREKMRRQRPDVIVLDIEMPRMDGLTFLGRVMSEDPIPVVVCSALTGAGTEMAMRALEEGAVEIVTKRRVAVQEFLEESALRIVDAIRSAKQARISLLARRRQRSGFEADHGAPRTPLPREPLPALAVAPAGSADLIAIGASTGGTEALREVLEPLPGNSPPIVVVQHMPEPFTHAFAKRLDRLCAVRVDEAVDGDVLGPGRVLIAPGDHHLLVHRSGPQYLVEVRRGPLVSRHRPSVDVLFRSVAEAARARAVGVILTGMGEDGAAGLLAMREAGAFTIAQDEATCVVFGMPREAIARGATELVLPLPAIGPAALRAAAGPRAPETPPAAA